MATKFITPSGDLLSLTGEESVKFIPSKGVMVSLPQFERPSAWIAETNSVKAGHIRDMLIHAITDSTFDYTQIDWVTEFKTKLDEAKKAKETREATKNPTN